MQDGYIGTPKEGAEPRIFPSDSNVYHFHPIAFVEQMKRITAPIIPPWLEIAIEKAVMASGAHESEEPLYSFAKRCLELGDSNAKPDDNDNGQWCGGFVGWCLNEVNLKGGTQAWEILSSQHYVQLAELGKFYRIIEEPVVGCIVVMTNYKKSNGESKGSGHICYLYGIDGNNLVCLGGNQGSYLKFSNFKRTGVSYKGSDYEQKFNCYLMPINYPESSYNRNVPTITAQQANKKININIETKENESTKILYNINTDCMC